MRAGTSTKITMKHFDLFEFIPRLSAINHRQGEQETKAAKLIMRTLDEYGAQYDAQPFNTFIPEFIGATLTADGKDIPAIPTSFVSGEIKSKDAIISSMISSQRFIDDSNINFNPHSRTISRSNHYFAPSVAVAPEHLQAICEAKEVRGTVEVQKREHESLNIVLGNLKDPEVVIMGHYDSIGPGVIDNASGTAMMMHLAINEPQLLEKTVIVIGGNEELSYDHPLYWGHGYRVFEEAHPELMANAKQIIGVDCVGHSAPIMYEDPAIVRLGVPLTNMDERVKMLSGDLHDLNPVYHSDADNGEEVPITQAFMNEAIALFLNTVT